MHPTKLRPLVSVVAAIVCPGLLVAQRSPAGGARPAVAAPPLTFVENVGQCDPQVSFVARTGPLTAWLIDSAWLVRLQRVAHGDALRSGPGPQNGDYDDAETTQLVMSFTWHGAASCEPCAEGALSARSHWFQDGAVAVGARHSRRVRYAQLYPGIDVVVGERGSRFAFDVEVQPGADLGAAILQVEGTGEPVLAADGRIELPHANGTVSLTAPSSWSVGPDGDERVEEVRFMPLGDGRIGFRWERPDPTRRLVVDPGILYGTYFGSSGDDRVYAAVEDLLGRVTVVGKTFSSFGLPITTGTTYGGSGDAWVAQLDPGLPPAQQLLWCTYLGGSGIDTAMEVEVDPIGSVVTVAGFTYSPTFPIPATAAYPSHAGGADGYVLQLTNAGQTIAAGTFFGGGGNDFAVALDVDPSSGDVAIAGHGFSANLPVSNAHQSVNAGAGDAFVARFDAALGQVRFATHFGGSGAEGAFNSAELLGPFGTDLAFASDGTLALATRSASANLPTVAPVLPFGGGFDIAVARYAASGTLDFASHLGGSGSDGALSIDVDALGRIVLAGYSTSSDFPVVSALQPARAGGFDGVLVRLVPGPSGYTIERSTYFGGSGDDYLWAVAAESTGAVLYGGYAANASFPSTPGTTAFAGGPQDGVVGLLAPTMLRVDHASFVGGSGGEAIRTVRPDAAGGAVVGGFAVSTNVAGLGGYQTTMAGVRDGLVLVSDLLAAGVTRVGAPGVACNGPAFVRVSRQAVSGSSLVLGAAGGPANVPGVVAFGAPLPVGVPLPQLGFTLWLDPATVLGTVVVVADDVGYAELSLPLAPGLQGATFADQVLWVSVPGCGSATLFGSNAVQWTVL